MDLDDRLMARHHTFSEEDLAVVRKRRGPTNRLGFAVLLPLLRFPGRPLRPDERAPQKIVRYVASQVGEDPRSMDAYAKGRESTRREHLSEISNTFGFRLFDEDVRDELRAWLVEVAAMTDSGAALVEALLEEVRDRSVIAPALYTVEELAWEARREARQQAAWALVGNLTESQLAGLDDLLPVAQEATRSPLVWLRQPPGLPRQTS